jgi:hypothetical protein
MGDYPSELDELCNIDSSQETAQTCTHSGPARSDSTDNMFSISRYEIMPTTRYVSSH